MNHLPECGYTPEQLGFGGINSGIDSTQPFISGHPCICDRLRTCEQRVEEAMDRAWTQTVALAVAHTRTATLDAAREAVAALQMGPLTTGDFLLKRENALAAIDALKATP